jgi:V/A-type H+-transporting ATPase subunit C
MLTRNDLVGLLTIDGINRLLGALADTVYGSDVEAALLRYTDLRCLDEAIRTHLARNLRMLPIIYEDSERHRLELLLHRWDLRNLRTILRGRVRLEGSGQIVRLLVPAGTVDEPALTELASQPSLRSTIELMMAWNLPSPATAGRLLAVWPHYEATGDPSVIEQALNRAYADHLQSALAGGPADELARILRVEVDQINVLTALRLRRSRLDEEPGWDVEDPPTYFLPAGRVAFDALEAARLADEPAAAADSLERALIPREWAAALIAWANDEDLVRLTASLEAATTIAAVSLFYSGDPLSIAIPVAFTWAKENEARNLRLIGRGVVHSIPPDMIERGLILA